MAREMLGVTGSMGCGKGYTCRMLKNIGEDFGVNVDYVDTDSIGRYLLGESLEHAPLREKIFDEFGGEYRNEDGSVNLPRITDLIFSSRDLNDTFSRIILPDALSVLEKKLSKRSADLTLVESALFAEYGFCDLVDYNMLVVRADFEVQMQRLDKRDGDTKQTMERVAFQYDNDRKIREIAETIDIVKRGRLHVFDTSFSPGWNEHRELFFDIYFD